MTTEIEVDNVTISLKGLEPQEFLAGKYRSIPALPIRGGWGYSEADAVVIDKSHPAAANFKPFNGVQVEHLFARLRMFEELIGTRRPEHQFAGCRISLLDQKLMLGDNGRTFDVLRFNITALPAETWNALKAEWEGPLGATHPDFDAIGHARRHEAAKVHYVGTYWFEISSFFGSHGD